MDIKTNRYHKLNTTSLQELVIINSNSIRLDIAISHQDL